jgi:DNA-binding HxlR family transcriptional regulator
MILARPAKATTNKFVRVAVADPTFNARRPRYHPAMPITRKQVLSCPIERAIHCIGARYKAMIVYRLLAGPRRYSDLRREVAGISERMLTTQLKQLTLDGVVTRDQSSATGTARARLGPPYRLTDAGERLRPVFDAMFAWGTKHSSPSARQ